MSANASNLTRQATVDTLRRTLLIWEDVLAENIARFEQQGDAESIISAHISGARLDTVRDVLSIIGRE